MDPESFNIRIVPLSQYLPMLSSPKLTHLSYRGSTFVIPCSYQSGPCVINHIVTTKIAIVFKSVSAKIWLQRWKQNVNSSALYYPDVILASVGYLISKLCKCNPVFRPVHLFSGYILYVGESKIFRTDAVKIINLTTKRVSKFPTFTQLRATWHIDSPDMVVLPLLVLRAITTAV
jgi:hypothetical protein